MVLCLIAAGFLEGISIAVLVPLLDVLDAGSSSDSMINAFVVACFGFISLEPSLGWLLLIMVTGMTLKAGCLWFAMRQVGYTISNVAASLRLNMISALMKARWSYFSSQPAGRFAHAISIEAYRASNAYYEMAMGLSCLVQCLVYAVIAAFISCKVALGALLFGGVMMWLLRGFIRMTRKASFNENELGKSLVIRLTDALQGIKPIRAMAREDHLAPIMESETRDLNVSQRRVVVAKESLKALQEPIMILVLSLGIYFAIQRELMSMSALMVLVFVFYRLATRSNMLQQAYQKMTIYEAGFWSLRKGILQAEQSKEASEGKRKLTRLSEAIRFDNVAFSYSPPVAIFKHLSFEIFAGSFVAIEGPSGGGKSTLADLLTGLIKPNEGRILVDGADLADLDIHAWRRMIGYVPQEMFLFHDTIYRNISLNDDAITRLDVEQALKLAGAWAFVDALPDKIDTMVGERGSRMSGGQRQRIALARALVCRPSLLILDEATTALDPETEQAICHSLQALRGHVTIVAISHQPAIVRAADRVFRLEGGIIRSRDRTKDNSPDRD